MEKKNKKEEWYPLVSRFQMRQIFQERVFSWLGPYDVNKSAIEAMELDVLEIINGACRAVYLKAKK